MFGKTEGVVLGQRSAAVELLEQCLAAVTSTMGQLLPQGVGSPCG